VFDIPYFIFYLFSEPPPPRDITASTVDTKVTNGDTRVFLLTLKWQPPANTSSSNKIEKYIVDVKAMSLRPQNHRTFQNLNINSSATKSKENPDNFNLAVFKPIIVSGVRKFYICLGHHNELCICLDVYICMHAY